MKTPRLFLSILLATTLVGSHAIADLTITQTVSPGEGKPDMEVTTKFKGDKLRVDTGDMVSAIVDGNTGDVTTLIHGQKMYMVVPASMIQAMNSQTQAAAKFGADQGTPEKPDLKPTGRTDTIGGMKATEYEAESQGSTMKVWITQDVPNIDRLLEQLAKFSKVSQQSQPGALDYEELPGFPVKTIIENPQLGKVETVVTSIEENDIQASEFEMPGGYKKVETPAIGN